MKRFLIIPLVCLCTVVAGQTRHVTGHKKAVSKNSHPQVSYKRDILPIVTKYCLPCHTEDQMNPSLLYLDSYDNMMAGGKHGKPVTPGKPDSSLIVQKISSTPPFGDPMPMKRKTPFPQDTLRVIRSWIEQGAKNN